MKFELYLLTICYSRGGLCRSLHLYKYCDCNPSQKLCWYRVCKRSTHECSRRILCFFSQSILDHSPDFFVYLSYLCMDSIKEVYPLYNRRLNFLSKSICIFKNRIYTPLAFLSKDCTQYLLGNRRVELSLDNTQKFLVL